MEHLPGHVLVGNRNRAIRDEGKLLPIGRHICSLERLSYSVEPIVRSNDKILIFLGCQLISAGLQDKPQEAIFVDGTARNRDLPLSMKHVWNTAGGAEVAIIFRKNTADFCGRAIFDVGGGLDNDRDAPRAISFVDNLFEIRGLHPLARAAFDGAIDVIVWHALIPGRLNRAAKTRVSIWIAAAGFRGDGNFLRELAEDLPTFRIDCAFETLDLRPLAVSGHAERISVLIILPHKLLRGARET